MLSVAYVLTAGGLSSTQGAVPPEAVQSAVERAARPPGDSAETLYRQLCSVGLAKSRVYQVRETSFDRAAFHITLEDGTLAFTEDVAGRVTGAFFEGEGEILLIPPNRAERASMALFTGAAILEERFATAYFRFNDETFTELQTSLRPAENAAEFVSRWNETAHNLAETDGLRLLMSFSQFLPVAGQAPEPPSPASEELKNDRMLHARVQGLKRGTFDLYFDSSVPEQIWAGQFKTVKGDSYYDVWTMFSTASSATRQDNLNSIVGEEGKPDKINISDYTIKTEVKPPTGLSVDASLQMEVRQGGQRSVLFELSRFLNLKAVEADGRAVEFIHNQALEGTQLSRRGNDLVAVVFPRPLETGQKIHLRFRYAGDVLSEAGGGLLYVGARGTWYPNRGMAMSNFDLQFEYPAGWTLVATGRREDIHPPNTSDNGGASVESLAGEQVSRWVSDGPIPLAGFNLGKYSRAVAHAGSVLVETYAASGMERGFPKGAEEEVGPAPLIPGFRRRQRAVVAAPPEPSPARNAQAVADTSARAIEFFAQRFGPYPYGQLALTQMPGALSQGWPGLIFLSSFSFLTPTQKSDLHMSPVQKTLSTAVIAHETAHQWWGDTVVWSGYSDQWMMEALANYSSMMLLESRDPVQFRAAMEKYREDLLEKNPDGVPLMEAGPVTLGARLSCSHFPSGYDAISYGRGTWLFHMLRYMMRDAERESGVRPGAAGSDAADEPFVRALRKVRARYQRKSISTRELLHVFEEELPPSLWYEGRKSLDWFYRGWVNGTAIPRLELEGVRYGDKGNSTAVSGTILQKLAADDLVTSVPVYAVLSGKTVLVGHVFADGAETQFHLTAPAGTRKVVLDPNRTLLVRTR